MGGVWLNHIECFSCLCEKDMWRFDRSTKRTGKTSSDFDRHPRALRRALRSPLSVVNVSVLGHAIGANMSFRGAAAALSVKQHCHNSSSCFPKEHKTCEFIATVKGLNIEKAHLWIAWAFPDSINKSFSSMF